MAAHRTELRFLRDVENLDRLNLSKTPYYTARIIENLEADFKDSDSPEILYLLDNNYRILIPGNRSGESIPEDNLVDFIRSGDSQRTLSSNYFPENDSSYLVSKVEISKPDVTILMIISRQQLLHRLKNTILSVLFITLSILTVTSFLLFRISVWFTRPILDLSDTAALLASGHLDARTVPGRNEEMAKLGNNFNHMAEELQAFTGDLEDRIAERTEALSLKMAELQESQSQLIRNEKLAALGSMVSGVAHEINTPLGVSITAASYLDDIVRDIEINPEGLYSLTEDAYQSTVDSIKILRFNLDRAVLLIKTFKQVSVDQHVEELSQRCLKNTLEEAVLMLDPKFHKTKAEIKVICPENLEVITYPGALWQILNNLLVNAIIHGKKKDGEGFIRVEAELNTGNVVCLRIIDNGSGINQKNRQQIFEPFFTTNRSNGGTGLGLHIVHNLVTQRLHGTIEYRNATEGGAVFQIMFPRELSVIS